MRQAAPSILNDLGLNYGRKGKTRDAAGVFRKTIELDPDYAEAYNNLGAALLEIGDQSSAEEASRNCIRLQLDFAGAHRNPANPLAAQIQLERAAIRLDPNLADAHVSLADMFALQGTTA